MPPPSLPLLPLLLSLTERCSIPATTAGVDPLLLRLLPLLLPLSLPLLFLSCATGAEAAELLPAASDAHEGAPLPTATGLDVVTPAADLVVGTAA